MPTWLGLSACDRGIIPKMLLSSLSFMNMHLTHVSLLLSARIPMLSSLMVLIKSEFDQDLKNHLQKHVIMTYSEKLRHIETVFADSIVL